tara:strand:- start:686 stop:1855 length:1170 start_codon:yes stop_codon:yes gene_type:complete
MPNNGNKNKKLENVKITYNIYMKIIFETKALLEKVKNVAPTAEAKQTLMILGNMVIKVESGVALFTTSDLEIQVSSTVPCEADENCEFSLPARKLLEILNALSDYDKVTFTITSSKVDITAGKSKISLPTLPTSDFPYMDYIDKGELKEIASDDLANIINKTSFAMAYQDARHFLNGLYLCSEDGKIVSVCTDGHRLAKYKSQAVTNNDISVIIPRKAVIEINRILNSFSDNKEKIMKYSYNSSSFLIQINDYELTSKLIEGNYPNFNKVIPETTSAEIIVNKSKLKNSLNIISKVVNQQYKGVKLTPNNNSMHLISSNTDSEIGEDQIDVEYSGDEISIGFNISYLQDVIDTLEGDTVVIRINDQNSGCIVQGNQDPDSTFVIMPMRV